MMNSIENNMYRPSFKKIILNKSTNKSNTAKYIISELEQTFPGDNKNRSVVKRAEDNGFDIYLEKNRGYTHVYLQKIGEDKYREKIGAYNSPEQFDINRFINIYQNKEQIENYMQKYTKEDKYWKAAILAIVITLASVVIHKAI